MPAVTFGTAGLVFAFSSAETGGLLQNLTNVNRIEKKVIKNQGGESAGVSLYDRTESITAEWYTTGTSGLGAIDPAEILTLANYSPAAGLILAESVTTSRDNENYTSKSLEATVWPLITS